MLPAVFLRSRWLFQVVADRARHAIPSYPLADTWLASTTKLIVSKLLSTVMTVIVLAIPPCIADWTLPTLVAVTAGIHRTNWCLPIHCVPDLVHDGIPCCVTCHIHNPPNRWLLRIVADAIRSCCLERHPLPVIYTCTTSFIRSMSVAHTSVPASSASIQAM